MAACASAFAAPSFADEPNGLGAAALASLSGLGHDPRVVELAQGNAVERWSLRAGSSRGAWDFTGNVPFPRFDWRNAIAGDVVRAGLAFDWQRRAGAGVLAGSAHGRLSRTEMQDGASDAAAVQRLRDSSIGAALRWSSASSTVGASLRTSGRDAEAGIAAPGGTLVPARADRLDDSAFALSASTELALGRARFEAGIRYDAYRANVRSDLAGHEGMFSAQALSPELRLTMPLPSGGDMFLGLRRGAGRDGAPLQAMLDPRSGAAVGRLDPLSNSEMVEIGFRRRLPLGIESTVSMFRAASDLEVLLTGENAITQFARPTVRQGVQAAAHYEPASWLSVDLQATSLRARFADGAAEYVPGAAERNASAAASMRVPGGWMAGLAVSYLGKRAGVEEASSLAASTFVNARLARDLSRSTRVSLDVFNILDQRLRDVDYFSVSRISNASGPADNYLFNPAEPRGFRLKLRTTF